MNSTDGYGGQPSSTPGPKGDPERIAQTQAVLDQIRPNLQSDGGDVQLVAIDDEGYVDVHLVGACAGCQMSQFTLRDAMEPILKGQLPWMKGLRPV